MSHNYLSGPEVEDTLADLLGNLIRLLDPNEHDLHANLNRLSRNLEVRRERRAPRRRSTPRLAVVADGAA